MEPITLRQLLEAVDGTLLGEFSDLDATFTAVDTDSRNIRPGSLLSLYRASGSTATPFSQQPCRRGRRAASPPEPGTAMSRESFM